MERWVMWVGLGALELGFRVWVLTALTGVGVEDVNGVKGWARGLIQNLAWIEMGISQILRGCGWG